MPLFTVNVRDWCRNVYAHASSPQMTEPEEVAYYSKDENGQVSAASRHQLKRFVNPPVNADLNEGYDTFIPKDHENVHIGKVIRVVRAQNQSALDQCDVVTYRNNLNKISRTPVALSDGWEVDCCQLGRVLYLEIRKSEEDPTSGDRRRLMYHGYRFEALCTGETDKPVNPNAEFSSIALFRLKDHRILVSSEIDCTMSDPSRSDNPIHGYVELKTMKILRNERDYSNMYRYRYPKYFVQSFFAGVPTVIVGSRTDDGRLADVRNLDTFSLPSEAHEYFRRNRKPSWDPDIMLNFLDYILSSLRYVCSSNLGTTIRIVYDSNQCTVSAFPVNESDADLSALLADCLKR